MQPPRETRQFPTRPEGAGGYPHDPARSGDPTTAYPAVDPAAVASSAPRRRRPGTGVMIALALLVVVLVVVIGLVGLELGLRKNLTDRLEREASASLGGPVAVELGGGPVVLSMLSGSLSEVHMVSDGTDPATSPVVDLTGTGIREDGDRTRMDTLNGTVGVSEEFMTRSAKEKQSASGQGSFLSGLTEVQSITAVPSSQTLEVSIGGLARVTVTPRVESGRLVLQPESASILGVGLPAEILGGTSQMVDQTLDEMPEGVEVTGVEVVDGGMAVRIDGRDVVMDSPR